MPSDTFCDGCGCAEERDYLVKLDSLLVCDNCTRVLYDEDVGDLGGEEEKETTDDN